jgi:phage tail-like protein
MPLLAFRFDSPPTYKYGVEIEGTLMAGFTSCSGLGVTRETKEVEEGGINDRVHILPGRIKYDKLTLKRGVTYSTYLWDWFHEGYLNGKVKRRNMTLYLYGVNGLALKQWNILEAYPVKWSGSEFRSDSQEVAIETVEFVHEGFEVSNGTFALLAGGNPLTG